MTDNLVLLYLCAVLPICVVYAGSLMVEAIWPKRGA